MNQDKRTLLPGLSLFVCFCLLTGMEKLITHFNLPPSLMALGEIVCFGLSIFKLASMFSIIFIFVLYKSKEKAR